MRTRPRALDQAFESGSASGSGRDDDHKSGHADHDVIGSDFPPSGFHGNSSRSITLVKSLHSVHPLHLLTSEYILEPDSLRTNGQTQEDLQARLFVRQSCYEQHDRLFACNNILLCTPDSASILFHRSYIFRSCIFWSGNLWSCRGRSSLDNKLR